MKNKNNKPTQDSRNAFTDTSKERINTERDILIKELAIARFGADWLKDMYPAFDAATPTLMEFANPSPGTSWRGNRHTEKPTLPKEYIDKII